MSRTLEEAISAIRAGSATDLMVRPTREDLFWRWVEPTGSCWLWLASKTKLGYGRVNWYGLNTRAHRVAYELLVGTIPEGLVLDHLCRNPPCVNPDHLEPVTMGENNLRGYSPTALNARKTACPQGHPYSEANTHVDRSNMKHCRPCDAERARRRRAARREEAAA